MASSILKRARSYGPVLAVLGLAFSLTACSTPPSANTADSWFNYGYKEYKAKNTEKAAIAFANTKALDAEYGTKLVAEGVRLAKTGQTTKAKAYFEQAAALEPYHPYPPYYLGVLAYKSGDIAKANEYWLKANALSEGHAEVLNNLGVTFRLLGSPTLNVAYSAAAVAAPTEPVRVYANGELLELPPPDATYWNNFHNSLTNP